ncbi:MAG TPA: IS1595 family transposase [Pyrinomonadaceae bacterium]|nr:IS1595 family transposase [Pyrinomonadaceae bacterium]
MNLMKLMEQFGTDEKCRILLEKLRWPDGIRCVRCGSDKISHIYKRNQFACDACDYHFSVTAGTIFHDSHLPLPKWFAAVYLMCESRKGISANQLKRTLGVAYQTAWHLCHRIRKAVADADTSQLSGTVEVDETFIGGKAKNMHKADRARRIQGRGPSGKAMVLAAIQRGGGVRLRLEDRRDRETLHAFIKGEISPDAERIMTDEFEAYKGIEDENTKHETVNHGKDEYVRGDVHTNTAEGVFSLFKRSIVGAFHQVSVKHLDRYLDEFSFRFDNRNNPYLFRDTLLRLVNSENLEYKELTTKTA